MNKEKISDARYYYRLNWLYRQMNYWNTADRDYKLNMRCMRGEIREIDFGINVHAEFSGRHYGVVIKNSYENNPLVVVIPLKTKKKEAVECSDIDLGTINSIHTNQSTIAVITQIRSIDKFRIFDVNAINQTSTTSIPKLSLHQQNLIYNSLNKMFLGIE